MFIIPSMKELVIGLIPKLVCWALVLTCGALALHFAGGVVLAGLAFLAATLLWLAIALVAFVEVLTHPEHPEEDE